MVLMHLYEIRVFRLRILFLVYRLFGILGFRGHSRLGGRPRIGKCVCPDRGRLLQRLDRENLLLPLNNPF